jgi:hypothetical protein
MTTHQKGISRVPKQQNMAQAVAGVLQGLKHIMGAKKPP